ncbi:polysaccharide deacetylase family protein [Rhodovastum atsumiense]|uniref:Chitooligosaccharide deacetylase n=1 Tax=Rhodovastum atsumiense TaxID=504468 RepID=A0A5M6IRF5_9PROT|nr:polysaccharide deacetylase family protein [Rhodovastum atsumiense]KAA5610872.1 polysaccharide deacetylase family protein [Rhodovastum atsumiense]
MHPFLIRPVLGALLVLLAGPCLAAPRAGCGPDALGVARVIAIGGGERLALGLQSYPRTLDLHDHEVVLTFDDGPAATTPQVLDALARECVRATFFLIGRNAEALPDLVRREVAEGHGIGHHSYSHPDATLRGMTEAAAEADITRGIAADERAGYGTAAAVPHTPFFRFPGFADTPALRAFLGARGMTVFGSDLWASDWRVMTPEAELALVMSRLEKARKGIILFHDSKAATAQMLPAFLRALKARGYGVVHMVPGAGPTPVVEAPPGWTSTTEAIIARLHLPERRQ